MLLEVQALDARVDQLMHRRRTLPEAAELEKLAAEHSRLRDQEVEYATSVADITREQKRADDDVEVVRARRDRDQQRLDSGHVSAAKELESLQSEIASLERRQGVLEDAELEIMERLEQAQAVLDGVTATREDVGSRAKALQDTRNAAWAEIDADVAEASTQRSTAAGGVPDDLLALYEKVRADRGGIGAAALVQRRCQGCNLQLDPAEVERIRGSADDVVLRCEECRRILVRTAESGL